MESVSQNQACLIWHYLVNTMVILGLRFLIQSQKRRTFSYKMIPYDKFIGRQTRMRVIYYLHRTKMQIWFLHCLSRCQLSNKAHRRCHLYEWYMLVWHVFKVSCDTISFMNGYRISKEILECSSSIGNWWVANILGVRQPPKKDSILMVIKNNNEIIATDEENGSSEYISSRPNR